MNIQFNENDLLRRGMTLLIKLFILIVGSVLKDTMSGKLLQLKESGILRALKEKWISGNSEHRKLCGFTTNENGDHILIKKHIS